MQLADCMSRLPVDDYDCWQQDALTPISLITPSNEQQWTLEYRHDPEAVELLQEVDTNGHLSNRNKLIYYNERLYVPSKFRLEVLRAAHSTPAAGHGGVSTTLSRISQDYWWPGLRRDVTRWVSQCQPCQKGKPSSSKFGKATPFDVTSRFELWALDFVGPITRSREGATQVLVGIDHFSKYIVTSACIDKNAQTVGGFIVNKISCIFGPPSRVLVDNAGEMVARSVQEVCKVMGVEHVRCTPYHSRGNACVERVNQTLIRKLAVVMAADRMREEEWPTILPLVTLAINTSKHSATGHSPHALVFGEEPTIPLGWKREPKPDDGFAAKLRHTLRELHHDALANSERQQSDDKVRFDRRRKVPQFRVGDKVLLEEKLARSGKLKPLYKGPFEVTEVLPNNIYKCRDIALYESRGRCDSRFSILKRHAETMKPFRSESDDDSDTTVTYKVGRRGGSSAPSKAVLAIAALALLACSAVAPLVQEESPILWRRTNTSVVKGTRTITVNVMVQSPCGDEKASNNSQHVSLRDLCERSFTHLISKPLNKWAKKMTPRRQRRDIGARAKKQAMLAFALGSAAYWAVSTLLESRHGQYDKPQAIVNNIGTNRRDIEMLHEEMIQLVKHQDEAQLAMGNSTRMVLMLAKDVQRNAKNIEVLMQGMPATAWTAAEKFSAIHDKATELADIMREWEDNRVSPKLASFTNISELNQYEWALATPVEVSSLGHNIISFVFTVPELEPGAEILKADSFGIWANLESTPCLHRYHGPPYLEYNSRKNCSRGLLAAPSHMEASSCHDHDYTDLNATWREERCVRTALDARGPQQVKYTSKHVYIYCFGDHITAAGRTRPCPPFVFRYTLGTAFNTSISNHTTAKYSYTHSTGTIMEDEETLKYRTGPATFNVDAAIKAVAKWQALAANVTPTALGTLERVEIMQPPSFLEKVQQGAIELYYVLLAVVGLATTIAIIGCIFGAWKASKQTAVRNNVASGPGRHEERRSENVQLEPRTRHELLSA